MFAIVGSVCVRRPGNGALRISAADKCHDPKLCRASHRKVLPPRICPARWRAFENVAKRKLDMLDAATKLSDVRSPPGNRLEALSGDRMSCTTQFRRLLSVDRSRPNGGSDRRPLTSHAQVRTHPGEVLREEFLAPLA